MLKWISSVAGGFVKVLHDERRPKGLSVGPLYVGGRPVVSGVYEAGSLVEVVLGVSESVFEFVKKAFEERARLVVEGVSVELSEFEFSKLTPRGPRPTYTPLGSSLLHVLQDTQPCGGSVHFMNSVHIQKMWLCLWLSTRGVC